jgi:transcription initiation factor TFIIH subunit 4
MMGVRDSATMQTILHYMVSSGSGQAPARPANSVLYLLERSELMGRVQCVLSCSYPVR